MPVSASAVLNFDAVKPPVYIETVPASPEVGQTFKVNVYSSESYTLQSPYNGIISGKTINPLIATQTEIVNLSGNAQIATKYPVAKLLSIIVACPIVLDVTPTLALNETRKVVFISGENLQGRVHAVNGNLAFANKNQNLHGSVKVVYQTFKSQSWTHQAFKKAGAILLYAKRMATNDFEPVALSINESSQAISFENHDTIIHEGSLPFRLYPADSDIILKATVGTISPLSNQQITMLETLQFDNEQEKAASRKIETLLWSGAAFFMDADFNPVQPAVSVVDGRIKLSGIYSGSLSIQYKSTVRLFDYTPHQNGNKKEYGRIIAYHQFTRKSAVFDVPVPTLNAPTSKTVICRIYRELLVANKRYEMPTTLNDTTISYASYPNADTTELEPNTAKIQVNQVEITWDGVTVWTEDVGDLIAWAYPTAAATTFADVKWLIETTLPTGASSSDQDKMNAEIDKAKAKYPQG